MLFVIVGLIIIQPIFSMSCQFKQMEYKTKFISKLNDYTLIEKKLLINWFYKKLIQMNMTFPWKLIGQQLDELNNVSFQIQLTFQLISTNSWIFGIIFLFLIIFLILTIKSLIQSKQRNSQLKNFRVEKIRHYSFTRKRKLYQTIFFIGFLLTNVLLFWMIMNSIEGILIERKIRDYIQKSSLELISFMEHTAFRTNCFYNSGEVVEEFQLDNATVHINSELNLALNGVSILSNMFTNLSIHLIKLGKLFQLWSSIRLITIVLIVLFLILSGFGFYLLIKKLHCSRLKSFPYPKLAFILSIIYWIGFILWYTKLIILLPHVAGACSACNDFQQKQVYNSLLFASAWFNATFLSIIDHQPLDIDQLIEKCQENSYLWSMNDFIRLGLLENKDINIEKFDLNQYHSVICNERFLRVFANSLKNERYFGHCQMFTELHNNFTNLFCHGFVQNLLHYLINSIITALSHLILYFIAILFRRFIQNHKYQFGRLNFSIRSLPILATEHSMK